MECKQSIWLHKLVLQMPKLSLLYSDKTDYLKKKGQINKYTGNWPASGARETIFGVDNAKSGVIYSRALYYSFGVPFTILLWTTCCHVLLKYYPPAVYACKQGSTLMPFPPFTAGNLGTLHWTCCDDCASHVQSGTPVTHQRCTSILLITEVNRQRPISYAWAL